MKYEIDIVHMELLKAFAKDVASLVRPGDVLALVGDIGAGKTTFTQSLFWYLGVETKVSSPTFNIVLLYEGTRFRCYHADLYRLETEEELDNIGFDEVLSDEALVVIEWADKMEAYLRDYASNYMELKFLSTDAKRTVSFEGELARRYESMKEGLPW